MGAILIQTPTASVEYEIFKGNVANHMTRDINSPKRIKFTGSVFIYNMGDYVNDP